MVNLSLVLKHISSHNPQEKKYNNGKDLNVTEKLQSVITTVIIIIAITVFFTWYILRWGTNASFIHENPMKAVKVTISLFYRWGNRGTESLVWRNRTKNITLSDSSIKLLFFRSFLTPTFSLLSLHYCVCDGCVLVQMYYGACVDIPGQLWAVSSFLPSMVPGTELRLSAWAASNFTHRAISQPPSLLK